MLTYRIIPYKKEAQEGARFSATYLPQPDGTGRIDNPRRYKAWYLAREPSGAVAEVFGGWPTWNDDMFKFGSRGSDLQGAARALVTYRLPDDLPFLDLDHAFALHKRDMKPTSVIERNRPATQAWALRIFEEVNYVGDRLWNGVQWWSFHRPNWRILGLWEINPGPAVSVELLSVNHPAVIDAADALDKLIER